MTKTSWPPNDPGKHVQTLLSSSEWKALRKLADSFGWSLTETTRWAINETVENETDHAELVEALIEAGLQLEYLDGKFAPTGTTAKAIARIDNVLAKLHPTTGEA